MPFGPFALQWRAPSPNPPSPPPLPAGITRRSVATRDGPLELLRALPSSPTTKPPLFFAHGGFGCASIWLSYMLFFAERGYACYAVSYRGHGASWYPGFWSLYVTSRARMAGDLVAGIEAAEAMEGARRDVKEKVRVVLVAHSAGGALSQYVLSRGMVRAAAFCMLAAVPGFGSWSVYKFWSLTAPIHFPYRLFHPRYILATTQQVHAAFFTPETPTSVVKQLERLLSPYESMLWPMQALFRFVTGPDVVCSIDWVTTKSASLLHRATPRFLILAAEHDVLCTPAILCDTAERYRDAFRHCVKVGKLDVSGEDGGEGVRFRVVTGLGHHLQNHVGWESGAEEILEWTETL